MAPFICACRFWSNLQVLILHGFTTCINNAVLDGADRVVAGTGLSLGRIAGLSTPYTPRNPTHLRKLARKFHDLEGLNLRNFVNGSSSAADTSKV